MAETGRKRRYEILLPTTHNDGRTVAPTEFLRVHDELVDAFGALSYSPTPVHGTWVHEGRQYADESRRFTVDVNDSPETREFFVDYKRTLEDRFEQIVIYVCSYPVDVV